MVVAGIFLALSKFFIVPWQTDLEFYGKNANNIIAMILTVGIAQLCNGLTNAFLAVVI